MFERFTERARKVVVLAQGEARHFNHNYIGTEHILLGLVRESESLAMRVIVSLGADPDEIRCETLQVIGEAPELDPLDLFEAEMESENIAESQMMFQPPAGSLWIGVRVKGRVRTLLLYLDYAAEDIGERSGTTDYGELLDDVAEIIEGREYRSVQMAVVGSGELVLDRFPRVCEVEVNAMRERFFERRTGSGVVLSAMFRR